MKKIIFLSLIVSSMLYADVVKVEKHIVNSGDYRISYDGKEIEFLTGINPGYGSALTFKGLDKNGNLEFYAVTDRGPNADAPKYVENGKKFPGKFFPVPDFTPSIGVIKVTKDKSQVVESIPLKNYRNEKISGRVIPEGIVGSTGEVALNFDMNKLSNDFDGLDTEGIAVDKDGNFWLCDEYGPFIVKATKDGRIIEKYGPKEGLPEILKYRVPNRGFEGLTIDENGDVYATVQSPLDIKGKQNGEMQNLIYMIDINGADEIEDNEELEYSRLKELKAVKKELLIDLRKYGWNVEKAEGLTILPDGKTIAVVNDNDFGLQTKIEDSENKNSEIDDYVYDGDKKEFFYKDKKVKKIKIGIEKNSEFERESQIWLFRLDDKLK